MINRKLTFLQISRFLDNLSYPNTLDKITKLAPTHCNELFRALIFIAKCIKNFDPSQHSLQTEVSPEDVHMIDLSRHQDAVVVLNEYMMVRDLFRMTGIIVQLSEFLSGNPESVYDSLEALIKYKIFRDSVMRQHHVFKREKEIEKEQGEVDAVKKEASNLEVKYLRIKGQKSQEAPVYNQLQMKKGFIEERLLGLQNSKIDAFKKKNGFQNTLNDVNLKKIDKTNELHLLMDNNEHLKKKIATNTFQTQEALLKARNSQASLINILNEERTESKQKLQLITRMSEQVTTLLDQVNDEMECFSVMSFMVKKHEEVIESQQQTSRRQVEEFQAMKSQWERMNKYIDKLEEKLNEEETTIGILRQKILESDELKQQLENAQGISSGYISNLTEMLHEVRKNKVLLQSQFAMYIETHKNRYKQLNEKMEDYVTSFTRQMKSRFKNYIAPQQTIDFSLVRENEVARRLEEKMRSKSKFKFLGFNYPRRPVEKEKRREVEEMWTPKRKQREDQSSVSPSLENVTESIDEVSENVVEEEEETQEVAEEVEVEQEEEEEPNEWMAYGINLNSKKADLKDEIARMMRDGAQQRGFRGYRE